MREEDGAEHRVSPSKSHIVRNEIQAHRSSTHFRASGKVIRKGPVSLREGRRDSVRRRPRRLWLPGTAVTRARRRRGPSLREPRGLWLRGAADALTAACVTNELLPWVPQPSSGKAYLTH